MADDQRTELLRGMLEAYLNAKGIDTSKFFSCLNKPAHPDKHPSMNYWAEGKKVVCHSACGVKWSIFDLIGHEYGLTRFPDQKDKVEAVLLSMGLISAAAIPKKKGKAAGKADQDPGQNSMGTNASYFPLGTENVQKNRGEDLAEPTRDFTRDYMTWHEARHKTDYWNKRGITAATLDLHSLRLGYDEKQRAVIIPCTPDYYVARYVEADVKGTKRFHNLAGSHVRLFNEAALDGQDPVFITEGWADALSVIQAGFPAMATNGAKNTSLVIAACEARKFAIPPIILLFDRDDAGRQAADKLHMPFKRANVPVFDAIVPEPYEDVNQMLIADSMALNRFLQNCTEFVRQEADNQKQQELNQTSFRSSLEKYLKSKVRNTYFPTGFAELDAVLNGGLQVGVNILGAQSSLGKTTLCLQIANHVAQNGGLVIIFSLEQDIDEMVEKSISLCSDGKLTQYEVRVIAATNDPEDNRRGIFVASGKKLHSYSENIHVIETARNVDQIGAEIARICALTGKVPLVIIDFLQAMRPVKDYQTDKQAVDYNMNELKNISKLHKIPILAISSISRAHYNLDITEAAFKESGGIEYSSDNSLGLQFTSLEGIKTAKQAENSGFDPDEEKANPLREVQVKVIKQRGGPAGKRAYFQYDAAHNKFNPADKPGNEFQPTKGAK